jgi:hypothetical protein
MGEMIRAVWHNASMADDATIAVMAHKELALDEMLQRETVQMCATRGDPMWNLNSLPPQSLRAAQEFMAVVAVAYRQGKGRQVPIASDETARKLFRQAVFWQESPLTKEDAAYFFGDDRADAARRCRVRLQFERNMLAIPESITLLRWRYAHP